MLLQNWKFAFFNGMGKGHLHQLFIAPQGRYPLMFYSYDIGRRKEGNGATSKGQRRQQFNYCRMCLH